MRGLGVGYEYLPEPGPVPVRFTDPRTQDESGGIKAIIRYPGQAWLRTVPIRRLMVPAVQDAFKRRTK